MTSPELKAALEELQYVQTIWFNEAGEWFFFAASGTVMSISRDEALGATSQDEDTSSKKKK